MANYRSMMIKAMGKVRGKFEKELKKAAKKKNVRKLNTLSNLADTMTGIVEEEARLWEELASDAENAADEE